MNTTNIYSEFYNKAHGSEPFLSKSAVVSLLEKFDKQRPTLTLFDSNVEVKRPHFDVNLGLLTPPIQNHNNGIY